MRALSPATVQGRRTPPIASAVANPTDLMKVRLQTDGMLKDAEGNLMPKKYSGMMNCLMTTIKEEGVFALWTGVGCARARASLEHAAAARAARVVHLFHAAC